MHAAGARLGRWARGRPSPRLVSACGTAFVALVLLAGSLAFGMGWIVDFAAWLVLATTFTIVGAAVVSRVPGNPFGWILLTIGATSAITVSSAGADVPALLAWLRSWTVYVPIGLLPVALMLFPTGHLPSRRWNVALALAVIGAAVPSFFLAVASALEPDPLGLFGEASIGGVDGLMTSVRLGEHVAEFALLLGVISLFARLQRATDIERRQILCLFVGAIGLSIGLGLEYAGVPGAWAVGVAALPAAAGVAILWHRLYDLDLFINRSLVYFALSAILLAAFSATVLLGDRLANRLLPEGAWTLIAVALVALSLDPLRRRLQRSVDRLLYGNRNDPYAVVTALGRGLGAATAAPTMLDDVAEAVARSLALPYVAIEVPSADGPPRVAEWGRCHGPTIGLPLDYRGEQIGRLLVTPRTVSGRLSERDRRLLEDVSHPVALTVNAVELSASLQRARQQLVTTREEERRRLRRDLHDGLGPTLAGMVMQLDAASNVLRRDPAAVEPVLAGLRTDAQDAVGDIRRLVYELRPPALDELGLAGAIRECTDRLSTVDSHDEGLILSLDAPPELPSLPAAIEVAALRIVQEAITNVARHSQARSCRVRLVAAEALTVDIEDDGRGLSADHQLGVGLRSMRERAAEVGGTCTIAAAPHGGTHVHAVLPLSSS